MFIVYFERKFYIVEVSHTTLIDTADGESTVCLVIFLLKLVIENVRRGDISISEFVPNSFKNRTVEYVQIKSYPC